MKNTKQLMRAALFIALMTGGAYLRFSIGPVPFTLQTMFCIVGGILLGAKWAGLAMGGYMLLGLMGLPLFAEGGGIGYVLKPSFGYIAGFVPAALVAGLLTRKKDSLKHFILAMTASLAVIYMVGILYLYFNFSYIQGVEISMQDALVIGIIPFVVPDLITGMLGILLARRLKRTRLFDYWIRPGEPG